MKYMMLIKSNARTEGGASTDKAFDEAMGAYNQALIDAGVWVTAEGFQSSANGARLALDGAGLKVENGPFENPEEVVAGFWIIDVASREEALDWAKKAPFAVEGSTTTDGSGEIELRRVYEFPADEAASEHSNANGNGASKPASGDLPAKRYIGMLKASPETETGQMPDPAIFEAMNASLGKLAQQGLFVDGNGLMPTSEGAIVRFSGGTPLVTDGPFAETKEAIAGYAIIRANSLDEMAEYSREGMEIEARWRKGPILAEIRELFSF